MLVEIRHDAGPSPLAAPVTGIVFEGRAARVHRLGDPLVYGGGRNEYRDLQGLQEICDGLNAKKPYTFLHPDGLISRGTKADIVGQVIGARIDGDYCVVQILVTDQRGIDAIRSGVHELSLGYVCQVDEHGFQRGIKVDHLAGVPRGRAGPSCMLRADEGNPDDAFHMDAIGACCPCNNRTNGYTVGTVEDQPSSVSAPAETPPVVAAPASAAPQRNIVMDELQKQLADALADAAKQKVRADQAEARATAAEVELKQTKDKLVSAEVEATNARASLDGANARADKAEQDAEAAKAQARLDADAAMNTAANQRADVLVTANRILGVLDRSKMSSRDIKLAVIKHVDNIDVAADKVDAYVDGVYEGAVQRADAAAVSVGNTRTIINTPKPGLIPVKASEAEKKARKDMADRKRAGKA